MLLIKLCMSIRFIVYVVRENERIVGYYLIILILWCMCSIRRSVSCIFWRDCGRIVCWLIFDFLKMRCLFLWM